MNDEIKVGVIMGSDSDFSTMKEALEVLDYFGVKYETRIISAHRTPDLMAEYGKNAYKRGVKVIIAAAGGAAHLPGMTASYSPIPVIGVPIQSKALNGLDSLLSIVQMPFGVPVATVAIGGAKNAAILAVQILGTSDENLLKKIIEFKETIAKESMAKNEKLGLIN